MEQLSSRHNLADFSCGNDEIDRWLKERALANAHLVSTRVCINAREQVRAFYALRTTVINSSGFSNAMRSGANQEQQSSGVLLCQMGVHMDDQGEGFGKALLKLAYADAARIHQLAPVNLFVLDAAEESLVGFYQKAGLRRIQDSLRLAAPMKTIMKMVSP